MAVAFAEFVVLQIDMIYISGETFVQAELPECLVSSVLLVTKVSFRKGDCGETYC